MERDTCLQGTFMSLLIYLLLSFPQKEGPSMFPNRVSMERDTLSPEPLVYSFIHVYMPESPKRSFPAYGEKHKVNVHRKSREVKDKKKCVPPDWLRCNCSFVSSASSPLFTSFRQYDPTPLQIAAAVSVSASSTSA